MLPELWSSKKAKRRVHLKVTKMIAWIAVREEQSFFSRIADSYCKFHNGVKISAEHQFNKTCAEARKAMTMSRALVPQILALVGLLPTEITAVVADLVDTTPEGLLALDSQAFIQTQYEKGRLTLDQRDSAMLLFEIWRQQDIHSEGILCDVPHGTHEGPITMCACKVALYCEKHAVADRTRHREACVQMVEQETLLSRPKITVWRMIWRSQQKATAGAWLCPTCDAMCNRGSKEDFFAHKIAAHIDQDPVSLANNLNQWLLGSPPSWTFQGAQDDSHASWTCTHAGGISTVEHFPPTNKATARLSMATNINKALWFDRRGIRSRQAVAPDKPADPVNPENLLPLTAPCIVDLDTFLQAMGITLETLMDTVQFITMDVEWSPDSVLHGLPAIWGGLASVQLALEWAFREIALVMDPYTAYVLIKKWLEREGINVGVWAQEAEQKLMTTFAIRLRSPLVDVQEMYPAVMGLATATAKTLGLYLPKDEQVGFDTPLNLSQEQRNYAANDVVATLRLLKRSLGFQWLPTLRGDQVPSNIRYVPPLVIARPPRRPGGSEHSEGHCLALHDGWKALAAAYSGKGDFAFTIDTDYAYMAGRLGGGIHHTQVEDEGWLTLTYCLQMTPGRTAPGIISPRLLKETLADYWERGTIYRRSWSTR